MAEIDRQRIKSLYGEINGIFKNLPTTANTAVSRSIGNQYNQAVEELTAVSLTDYSRHKLSDDDRWLHGSGAAYDPNSTRAKIGSLVERLEEEHDFGNKETSTSSSPVIVTVNANQQLTVSVTPIQQLIDSAQDDKVKEELAKLNEALSQKKDSKTISNILIELQKKSWEIFIKALPFVLEHWGQHK